MTVGARSAALWVAAALAACGGEQDPCAGIGGSCLELRITSPDAEEIDQLELDLLYGGRHATTSTQADGGRVVSLPIITAVELDVPGPDPLAVGVVAAGKLSGRVLGAGAATALLEAGEHASVDIQLAPIEECTAGGHYCGGDRVAGDPDTLYECNVGGVPLARGACLHGCAVRPGDDDTCRAGGDTCVEGAFYCGGDKLDGDPQTLYRCAGGIGTEGVTCGDRCVVRPGMDDVCR
jgi:hypothetical protein